METQSRLSKFGTQIRMLVVVVSLVLLAVQGAFAQAVITLPDYSTPLLTPASQASTAWTNVIPNALASYFTYVPYSNADAVALGFPASCGNPAKGTPADLASTEDCYTITVKKFTQQLALPGIFGGGAGLLDQNGVAFGAATKVHGYGSGGQGWTPPGATAVVTGNAPAPFVDGTLSTAGIWHFPAPTIRGTKGRPIRVQWLNELPNEMPSGFDPTVDCGLNAPNCYPYNRIVTHVHGAHVPDDSDGYAGAWFTPGFALTGPGWLPSTYGPEGTYRFPMDQEASTIWYHDHAMGVTHNNTQMGMAGFFPITDANEQALIASNILPTGAYELGFALQDRMFDINGQFAMPDYPVYDLNSPGCTLTVDGLADPATCRRLDWMKAADGHLIPYVPGDPLLALPINAGAPFPAASTTLEYFGNMPVVNGVTYGSYSVEPRIYRMRFIGGTDSRTWIMKLVTRDIAATVIPFWQIGSEQGLLSNPVLRNDIDLMPGERVDVLVDLTGIAPGTRIVMKNIGPDAPYAGPDMLLDPLYQPSIDIPEIMEFLVTGLTGTDLITRPSASTILRAPIPPLVPTPGTAVRNVSLVEITDELGRTMPTIDSRGFFPGVLPITEAVRLNDTEEWNIINTTVDAHPMHLHLVAFQVVGRQAISTFISAVTDTVNGIYTQPQYTGTGPVIPPAAWESGWKDTVDCPPGFVTTIRAKFDIAGDKYVWHCHILSHEEHDMMRPMSVSGSAVLNFAAGPGGSISGTLNQTVLSPGSATEVTAVPNAGYHFVNWTGTGVFISTTANPLTVTNVRQDMDITANFAIDTFTVTGTSGGNGTIAPSSVTTNYNNVATFTLTPDLHYHIASVTGCGGTLTGNIYTTGPVTANCTVAANFAIDALAVNFIAGTGGSITGTLNQTVPYGGSATAVTAVPAAGYTFVNWTGTGGFVTTTAAALTVTNVTAAMDITANFAINTYPVNFIAGAGGTISGTLAQTVAYLGSATTVTAVPNAGYLFVNWTGTGGFVSTAANPLTVANVTGAMNITANFVIIAPISTVTPISLPFGDQLISTISTTQFVTVANTGNAPLIINSIRLGGLNPGQFAQISTCPIKGVGLAPGASCTISATFAPKTIGIKSATLAVNVAAPALSTIVMLTGNATAPTLTATPAIVSFGAVTRGLISAPQIVTIANPNLAPVTFNVNNGFAINGLNPKQFTLLTGGTCINGGILAAGASCTVTVNFAPTAKVALGAKTANLVIRYNSPLSPLNISLSGTAQ